MANCKNCVKADVCKHYEPKSTTACKHYAEPAKHSKWEISCDGYYPYCKECQYEPPRETGMTDYCPNCGAKMDGEDVQNERV